MAFREMVSADAILSRRAIRFTSSLRFPLKWIEPVESLVFATIPNAGGGISKCA